MASRPGPIIRTLLPTALAAFAAALVVLSGCDGGETAGPRTAAGAPESTNAASVYRDIHDRIDPRLSAQAAEMGALDPLPPSLSIELGLTEPVIEQLIEATRLQHCDFGIDMSQGVRRELSHLSDMRALARILGIDALRVAELGDVESAARRVAGIVRLSAHSAQGDFLVTKLVAMANVMLATDAASQLLDQNALTPEGRELIADALRDISYYDPFNAREAVAGELDLLAHSLRQGLVDTRLTGGPVPAAQRERTAVELECLGPAFLEAWDAGSPIAELERVEASTDDELARRLMPDISGFRAQYERTRVAVAAAIARLDG